MACKSADSVFARRAGDHDPLDQPIATIEPIDQAAPVRPNRPLFIPMKVSESGVQPRSAIRLPESTIIRGDDGRSKTVPVRYLGIKPRQPEPESIARFDQWEWLGPPLEYTELTAEQVGQWWLLDDPARSVVVLAQIDHPDLYDQGVHFGTRRVRLVPMRAPLPDTQTTAMPDLVGRSARWRIPDRDSPWESFRCALFVRSRQPLRQQVRPPDAQQPQNTGQDSLPDLYGRQIADRWLAALAQLAIINPDLERALVNRLLCTVWDEAAILAAWPAAGAELAKLDAILMSRFVDKTDNEQWRDRVKIWLDRQPASLHWIEHDSGDEIILASANLTEKLLTATADWSMQTTGPTRLQLPASQIVRHRLPRPPDRPLDRLIVACAGRTSSLDLAEPRTPVLPPGIEDRRFRHARTLADWYSQSPRAVPPDDSLGSVLAVQRSPETGQWQVVVHASITLVQDDKAPEHHSFFDFSQWTDLVGHESVTVFIGPAQSPLLILSASPNGQWREWTRSMPVESDRISVDRTTGRWTLTLTLPDALSHAPMLDVGVVRTHAGLARVDSLPHAVLPWRPNPGRRRFDLTIWDPLPAP